MDVIRNGSPLTYASTLFTITAMTRHRSLTKLELLPAHVGTDKMGRPQSGWVQARWERSDGSKGSAFAGFRLRSADRWYVATLVVDVPTAQKLRDVPVERIATAANADPQIRKWIEDGNAELATEARRLWARRPHKLQRPAGHQLDDGFYERVAAAYREALMFGQPPAKTLARDSDTAQGTVNRWIREARSRGYLN
jgi:hypothetical protein